MVSRGGLICVLFFSWYSLLAQQDATIDTSTLNVDLIEVTVTDKSSIPTPSIALQNTWRASTLSKKSFVDISELLLNNSAVYVKSYGGGGLATVSIRGTGSGRSSTTWNGMPLLGSTLGLLDYSLLNANLFEEIKLTIGGDSPLYGSGSIGGNIDLNNIGFNEDSNQYKLELKSVIGSFGRFQQGVKYQMQKDKWAAATRLSYEYNKQNFKYQIREDLPEIENTNARRKQFSVLQSLFFKPNDAHELAFHFWAADNERQIPPTTVQTRSEAKVRDKVLRLQGIWTHNLSKHIELKTIGAVTHNQNVYTDSLFSVFGDNIFNQLYLKSEATLQKGTNKYMAGLSNRNTGATTNNYELRRKQNNLSVFASYQKSWEKLNLKASARQEIVNQNWAPWSGKLEGKYRPNKDWYIMASLHKHYRVPALNDLYWTPGGDENLSTEKGFSQELEIAFDKNEYLQLSINGFNHHVNQWIQWGLLEERTFFSALNLPRVWSRGVQSSVRIDFKKQIAGLVAQFSHQYNKATYEFSLRNPDITEGEQIFYTPKHQASADVIFSREKWGLSYTHKYQTSVTSSIGPLDGFHIGNLHGNLSYKRLTFFIEINNLWDVNYRVIERRVMPGRNYNFGINFKLFNKTNI